MLLKDAVRIRFNMILKEKNIDSLWEFYKTTGVPKSTINALFSSKTNSLPRLPTLLHLCEGLNISLQYFFNDPIFKNVEDYSEDK